MTCRRMRAAVLSLIVLAVLAGAAVAGNVLLLRSASDAGDPVGQLSARLPHPRPAATSATRRRPGTAGSAVVRRERAGDAQRGEESGADD